MHNDTIARVLVPVRRPKSLQSARRKRSKNYHKCVYKHRKKNNQ